MVPSVLETYGAIGKQANRYIQLLAKAAELHTSKQLFKKHAYLSLSIALQIGNAMVNIKGAKVNHENKDEQELEPKYFVIYCTITTIN